MSLDFKTTLDDSQFNRTLKSMASSTSATARDMTEAFGMVKGAIAGIAAGAVIGTVVSGFNAISEHVDTINDLSAALDLTGEQFQGFSQAFAQSGVEAEAFTKAIANIEKALSSAREGSGEAQDLLAKNGISINAGTAEAILQFADHMKNATDKTEAFTNAATLAGAKNIKFIGALAQGGDELNRQAGAASKASDAAREHVDGLGDTLTRMKDNAKAAGAEGMGSLIGWFKKAAPTIQAVTDRLSALSPFTAAANALGKMAGNTLINGPDIGKSAGVVDRKAEPEHPGLFPSKESIEEMRKAAEKATKEYEERDKEIQKGLDEQYAKTMKLEEADRKRSEEDGKSWTRIQDMQRAFYEDGLSHEDKLKALEEDRYELSLRAATAGQDEAAAAKEKLAMKDLEIQKEERLNKEKGKQRLIDNLTEAKSKAQEHMERTHEAALAFALLTPDQRRQTVRDERREQREKDRLDRITNRGGRDARFGANQKDRSLGTVALDKQTIGLLAAELDKLIARP